MNDDDIERLMLCHAIMSKLWQETAGAFWIAVFRVLSWIRLSPIPHSYPIFESVVYFAGAATVPAASRAWPSYPSYLQWVGKRNCMHIYDTRLSQAGTRHTIRTFWCSRTSSCLQLNGKHDADDILIGTTCAAPATVKQASS